jgi:hypothetical protein
MHAPMHSPCECATATCVLQVCFILVLESREVVEGEAVRFADSSAGRTPTSAPGLGSPRAHLHQDWARPARLLPTVADSAGRAFLWGQCCRDSSRAGAAVRSRGASHRAQDLRHIYPGSAAAEQVA